MKAEKILMDMLLEKRYSLSTAESCTGGLISSLITSLPGASLFFKGTIVAYDNSIKTKLLSVSLDTLKTFGAVSSQVVEQMALGVSSLMETECSVSVSGVAGPGGGTADKPVGLVYIGSSVCGNAISRKYLFGGNRAEIRTQAVDAAINQLTDQIKGL